MIHWLVTAFSTYVLHPLHANGYQFWSGIGADTFVVAWAVGLWRHVNCEHPGCWRPGHRHPAHGRPVCRKHYHENVGPKGAS